MSTHADVTLVEFTAQDGDKSFTPIDLAYLDRTTFSDKALAREVLSLFRTSAVSYVEGLKSAKSEKDWHDAAHSLKGSAKAVGAFGLAELAAVAEQISGQPHTGAQVEAMMDLELCLVEVDMFIVSVLAQD